MCKRLLLIVLFVLSMVSYVFSGITGKIAGKITDENGEPLVGANVVLQGTTLGAATDAEGDYYIINIPPGAYTLTTSMMGYTTVSKTEVSVSVDRTTTEDFSLKSAVISGEEVVAVAEREVIAMDRSASVISISASEVRSIPTANSVDKVISLQTGVDWDPFTRGDGARAGGDTRAEISIRGGERGQTELMVDGLTMVDNRGNRPLITVNPSAIEEINVVKGGFNAEYGNVRSGLINIVTKEGSASNYNGSFEARVSPGHRKHFGESIYDPNNYFMRPYLDPAVAYVGTANGGWDGRSAAR